MEIVRRVTSWKHYDKGSLSYHSVRKIAIEEFGIPVRREGNFEKLASSFHTMLI